MTYLDSSNVNLNSRRALTLRTMTSAALGMVMGIEPLHITLKMMTTKALLGIKEVVKQIGMPSDLPILIIVTCIWKLTNSLLQLSLICLISNDIKAPQNAPRTSKIGVGYK